MPSDPNLAKFIQTQFPSIWALEVLIFLHDHSSTVWTQEQLVADLRASSLIITNALHCLQTGGLVEVNGQGESRYAAATHELDQLASQVIELYKHKPTAVRSLIINSYSGALSAFSESFSFRK
jgi:hypothetical protein